jgi:hypothetical protein
MTPIERRSIDYSELEGAMAHLELTIRDTRRTLEALARGGVMREDMDLAGSSPGPGQSAPTGKHRLRVEERLRPSAPIVTMVVRRRCPTTATR